MTSSGRSDASGNPWEAIFKPWAEAVKRPSITVAMGNRTASSAPTARKPLRALVMSPPAHSLMLAVAANASNLKSSMTGRFVDVPHFQAFVITLHSGFAAIETTETSSNSHLLIRCAPRGRLASMGVMPPGRGSNPMLMSVMSPALSCAQISSALAEMPTGENRISAQRPVAPMKGKALPIGTPGWCCQSKGTSAGYRMPAWTTMSPSRSTDPDEH